MAWYQLAYRPAVAQDLSAMDKATAQRLLDKTKWLASNAGNLRHEGPSPDLPGLFKYAVGDWRIFYTVNPHEQLIEVLWIVHRKDLRGAAARPPNP